jgi:hypothetical protein
VSHANTVWVPPSATTFSCLCESCLDRARTDGHAFPDAVRTASVRGRLPLETNVGFARCAAGHEIVVRRVDTPGALVQRDARQLQIV